MMVTIRNSRRHLTRFLRAVQPVALLLLVVGKAASAHPTEQPTLTAVKQQSAKATGLFSRKADRTITGKITDENDQALPGVSIVIKNTTTGTASKADGSYELTVKDGSVTLVYSFLGYVSQEVTVGNKAVIDVKLLPNAEQLKEVVVVGYGTQQKKDLTGAVGSISSKDIETSSINTPDKALQGKIAGVQVHTNSHAPGGGMPFRYGVLPRCRPEVHPST